MADNWYDWNSDDVSEYYTNTGMSCGAVKPALYVENGDNLMDCDNTRWFKDLYALPFTGHASSGMSWVEQLNFDLWSEFGKVNYFLSNHFLNEVDLEEDSWQPGYTEMNRNQDPPHYAECIYLRKYETNHHRFVGVLFNRNWNFWTKNNGLGACIDAQNIDEEVFLYNENEFALDVEYDSDDKILIKGFESGDLGDAYRIEYFDPDNLDYEGACDDGNSVGPIHCEVDNIGLNGLNLTHFPTMYFDTRPILFFRAFRDNGEDVFSTKSATMGETKPSKKPKNGAETSTSNANNSAEKNNKAFQLNVFPNPANGVIAVVTNFPNPYVVKDVLGRIVLEGHFIEGMNTLDLTSFSASLFILECGGITVKVAKS